MSKIYLAKEEHSHLGSWSPVTFSDIFTATPEGVSLTNPQAYFCQYDKSVFLSFSELYAAPITTPTQFFPKNASGYIELGTLNDGYNIPNLNGGSTYTCAIFFPAEYYRWDTTIADKHIEHGLIQVVYYRGKTTLYLLPDQTHENIYRVNVGAIIPLA